MLDPGVSDAPEERFGESSAPAGAEFMQQTNDPLGLDISHDSSSLHIDLPPSDSLSSEDASYWQSETSQFEIDQTRVDNDPPLLRSDALGFDQGMIEGVEENGAGPASGTPLIDFDTSALESGLASSGQAPPSLRRATISAERSVQALQAEVQASPDNWTLRRELAEAMLESGDREGGVRELEAAMMGAERADELDLASSLAEEIARLAPDTVRFHQKRVEYAFRTNDKLRLIE